MRHFMIASCLALAILPGCILSGIVGPSGAVLLVNNPDYDAFGKKGLAERLAGKTDRFVRLYRKPK